MFPNDPDVIATAQQYSIPPAILMGVVTAQGAANAMGLTAGTLAAYNVSPDELASNPELALTIAARTLQQSFQQNGSWEPAISQYLTGNPQAWSSQSSSVGGQVLTILGAAASDPGYGLANYQPIDITSYQSMSTSFADHLDGLSQLGGIVSPDAVKSYRQQSQAVYQKYVGNQRWQTNAFTHQVAEDILAKAHIPINDANVAVISTMAKGEGMPLGDFNWLATTSNAAPSVGTVNNTPGVKQYASYEDGITATAQTLLNGNYDSMISLMRSGADLKTIASNPGVQQNLRTWQGGSNEDVRNLASLADVPGGPGSSDKTPPPPPSKVGEFAAQLQGNNIDPKQFSQYFSHLSTQRRKLLGSVRTTVSDYADMQMALAAKGRVVDEAGISEHVAMQPHPTFPTHTAGQIQDTFDRASLYSTQLARRFPTMSETARLVGLDNKELVNYFTTEAEQKKGAAAAPAAAPAKKDNVVQLPQQRQVEQQRGLAGGGGFSA